MIYLFNIVPIIFFKLISRNISSPRQIGVFKILRSLLRRCLLNWSPARKSSRGASLRAAVILTNAIIRPIITIRNDRPRARSREQLWRFLGPGIAQRDHIADLLLVWWYMSSLCAPYCVNRIFMIYMVDSGSLPSLLQLFLFFPLLFMNRATQRRLVWYNAPLQYHNICSIALKSGRPVISPELPFYSRNSLSERQCAWTIYNNDALTYIHILQIYH